MDRVVEAVRQAHTDYHRLKGGSGSGNFGHAGRPGKIGGSVPGSGGDLIIGHIIVKNATPEQAAIVTELIHALPSWHSELVNDRVVSDTLQQYRHLPNYEALEAPAREAMQTGHMIIDFRKSLDAKTNPLTGESVQAIGGHIPNSITLDANLKGNALKDILAHELGHQVSYLASKLAPIAELRYGRNYKPAGEGLEAAWKKDKADHRHMLGVSGAGSERYQRWADGFKAVNGTTSNTYFPMTNVEERFAEAYRLHATGQADKLTPSVARYIAKFFNKKPPAGSVGVN